MEQLEGCKLKISDNYMILELINLLNFEVKLNIICPNGPHIICLSLYIIC